MRQLVWRNLVGQERVRQVLSTAFAGGTVGHAYLFCGEQGVGTVQAALDLAAGMLCRAEDGEVPCGRCEACHKLTHRVHPDLIVVVPVVLEKEHRKDGGLSDKGWQEVSRRVQEVITAPYENNISDTSPLIPVDVVREAMRAIGRGPVEGRHQVTVVIGAEFMNKESSNTMLKTLEEPPAGCTVILCTENLAAVLPTIRSRCQVVRFGPLADGDIREALKARGLAPEDEAVLGAIVDGAQGSLAAAIELARNPQPEALAQARRLWQLAYAKDVSALVEGIEALGEPDGASAERILIFCMHIIREQLVAALGQDGSREGRGLTPCQAERLLALCRRTHAAVRARAIIPLALLNFALEAGEIINGQE